jgi:hypothetical protein
MTEEINQKFPKDYFNLEEETKISGFTMRNLAVNIVDT